MNNNIEVVFNQKKKSLTIKKNGKVIGGFVGEIALRVYEKITFNNAKIDEKNGVVQPII